MRKNDSLFCLLFTWVKSDELQIKCLPLMISHAWNHAELLHSIWRNSGSHESFQNFKNSHSFGNLNDADIIYRCLCLELVKLRWNELFCSCWEIANRHLSFDRKFTVKLCENFSRKRKNWFSFLSDAYIITSMPIFATYRAKVEHSI